MASSSERLMDDRELSARFQRIDERLDTLAAELRGELRQQGEVLRAEMRQQGEDLRAEMRQQGEDLRAEMRQQGEDLRRYMLMLTENVRDDIRLLAESSAGAATRLDGHERRITRLEER